MLRALFERLCSPPETKDEWVMFRGGVPTSVRSLVRLQVRRSHCLSRSQRRQLPRTGTRFWWLRHARWGFADLPLPPGDQPFSRRLWLPPGHYTLGTGPLRYHFTVGDSLTQ